MVFLGFPMFRSPFALQDLTLWPSGCRQNLVDESTHRCRQGFCRDQCRAGEDQSAGPIGQSQIRNLDGHKNYTYVYIYKYIYIHIYIHMRVRVLISEMNRLPPRFLRFFQALHVDPIPPVPPGLRERDLLFQTLDTTMRKVKLPSGGHLGST